jgi:MFS family permease
MTKPKLDYTKILPVLFLEYLVVSLARSLVPSMIVDSFGAYSYLAVGVMETLKGLLAFVSSPLFGKLSDKIGMNIMHGKRGSWCANTIIILGRKYCLLATVLGTTLPVCLLAFTRNMYAYGAALSISGFFSATFALTFAYISDCVDAKHRAPAYGLALATFGLSFTVGPIAGGYIAMNFGEHMVFVLALILVVVNVLYIVFKLPETAKSVNVRHLPPLALNAMTQRLVLLCLSDITAVGAARIPEVWRGNGVPPEQLEVCRDLPNIQVWLLGIYICFPESTWLRPAGVWSATIDRS